MSNNHNIFGFLMLVSAMSGPKAKEVVKSFKNKVIGETTGNSILGKDFDLGQSIVSQGANLKAKIVEKIIDTTLDKEKNNLEHIPWNSIILQERCLLLQV